MVRNSRALPATDRLRARIAFSTFHHQTGTKKRPYLLTIFMVEQNVGLAIAHHGYVLQTGRIVLSGSARELRNDRVSATPISAGAEAA
jgi:ABC-type branched-subunit amino acid transport system ATPase component